MNGIQAEETKGKNLMLLKREFEAAEKKKKVLLKARNNACAAINDAQARYIKKKTGARSRKFATEKDALLKDPRFDALQLYDRREDILEAYGCAIITEKERYRLEDLWDEREEIRERVVDGFYMDKVTEALDEAYTFVSALWEDEVEECNRIEKEWTAWEKEAVALKEAFDRKVDEEYRKLMNG